MTDGTINALLTHLRERVQSGGGRPDEVLVHEERLGARPARMLPLSPRLPPPLSNALRRRGVTGLYAHQTEAIQAVRDRCDVVITTPTASGKSYAFNLPVLERLLLYPGKRALYLYPTKALMNDQLRGLQDLIAQIDGPVRPRVGILSGDLSFDERGPLRRSPPDILLANPDIVHHDLLRRHSEWQGFLATLDVLVLDELHDYRGVFGSHVALILRRLLRVAAHYGATPTCIAASATIANPEELAGELFGRTFRVVDGDGAGAGARRFVVWRPPLRGPVAGNRHAGVAGEAAMLFVELVQRGRRVILFGPSRAAVEGIFAEARAKLGPAWESRISAYRSGYTPAERVRIESDLREGRIHGVVTTNALELGIDIGALDTAILAG